MMIPQTSNETNIKLPFAFILFSLLSFIGSQLFILLAGDDMLNGIFRTPALLTAAHLLVLGWALMVAMGAMYQLVPVAFLTPIWSERFGFFQFFITALGIGGFALSLTYFPSIMMYTGGIAVLGIVLFVFQMFMTIKKQTEKTIITLFVGTALLSLFTTILFGILMTINLSQGLKDFNHIFVLKSHILLGLVGWFSLLIFGFSYKMVPMFSLAHGFSMKLAKWVYIFYVSGLFVALISFYYDYSLLFVIGLALLFIGFSLFSKHIYSIVKVRIKKKLDRPFIFSLLAIGFGLVIHLIGLILSFVPSVYNYYGLIIYLFIFGWIVFSIIGYLYKIVPFLWWTHRYSKQIGKAVVPTLKQMIDEKLSIPIFIAFYVGVIGVTFSILFKNLTTFYITQSIMLLASIFFSYAIIMVIRK